MDASQKNATGNPSPALTDWAIAGLLVGPLLRRLGGNDHEHMQELQELGRWPASLLEAGDYGP